MLDDASDFKSIPSATMAKLSGMVTADGALVDPMPVRCDCASSLPFSSASTADSYFCGDIRVIDPLWLLEAVQERESFLSGYLASVPTDTIANPKLMSGELLAVANALKSWASRWESNPSGVGCFVKGDAFEDFSGEWEDVIAVTLTSSMDFKDKSSSVSFDFTEVPGYFRSWSPDDDELEQMTKKDVGAVFGKYALRDYLSIPRFLGVETEDEPGEGVFGWKDVDDWPGYYAPLAKASDVLLLYSDLEATNTAVIDFRTGSLSGKKTGDEPVTDRVESLNWEVEHGIIVHGLANMTWEGCPAMVRYPGSGPSVSVSSNPTKATYSLVPTGVFDHLAWSSALVKIRDSGGIASEYDLASEVKARQREAYACVTKVSTHPEGYHMDYHGSARTSRGVFPTPTSTHDTTRRYEEERKLAGSVEMDLRDTGHGQWGVYADGRDQEVDSAYVLVSSIAVSYEAKGDYSQYCGAMKTASEDYPDAYGATIDVECKVNIRVKKVQCTVRDNRYLTVPSFSADEVPEASGGAGIEIEPPDPGSDASGQRLEPAWHEHEGKAKGRRKAITGIGPVIVKFKPKTSVKE